ncbi:MAG TPA: TonB-dependent receptor [Polyangiales bacterium]|nr:TonB-dependent receptor [Polyangiales bacterium]
MKYPSRPTRPQPMRPLITLLCSLCLAHPLARAHAQTPPPAPPATEPGAGDELIVVGTKLKETAGSVDVVRAAELERFEHDDPHAVLAAVPGVYVRGEDGFGLRPNIGLRGANPDRSKKVTLMEDGVLVGPAPYTAPAAYYFPLITRMSEVRVFKGPGSVAYGPQTVGGAIDLRTRAIPNQLSATLDLAGGSYFYRKLDGTVGTSFEHGGFLLEGVNIASDGFKELRGVLEDSGETGFYRNEWLAKARYDLGGELANELALKLTYSEELSNETYLGLTDDDFRADPLQRYGVSRLDQMRNHRTSVVLTHTLDLSDDAVLTSDAYRHDYYRVWRKVNRFGGADLFGVLSDPNSPRNAIFHSLLTGESDSSTAQETLFIGPNEREFVSQGVQSRLHWELDGAPLAHRIELGARMHYDGIVRHHSEDGFALAGGELIPDGNPTLDTALNEAWTYALALHVIDAVSWGALTLTPGLRLELIRSEIDDRLDASEHGRNAHTLVPGIGAFVAITRDLGLLAGVYRGFSPPPPGSEDAIEPELSANFEAGARFVRGAARAELIGFYNDYQNLTAVCTFSSGCSDAELDQQIDAGRARIYGFEALVEHAIELGSGLALPLRAAYTLTRTELLRSFRSDDPIFGDVERGDELPYVPEHELNASAGLEHQVAGGSATVSYVAAMREQPGSEPLSQVLATDDLLSFDLNLYYRPLSYLELYANARNLLDSHDIVSRRPFGARPNAPRMLQLGVKLRN